MLGQFYFFEKSFAQRLLFFAKRFQNFIHLLIAFKCCNEIPLFVVQCHEWKALYFKKRGQYELSIPAHMNIVFGQFVLLIKTLHGFERLVGGHYNLDLLKRFNVLKYVLSLMLAMFTIWTEIHQQHLLVLF